MRKQLALLVIALSAPQPGAAAADRVPSIDIIKNCSFEAESGLNPQQTKAHCIQDEKTAKEQLGREWSKFDAGLKRECMELTAIGGEQSYVELRTCLEMPSGSAGNKNAPRGTSKPARGNSRAR
jgi:hypothetical protein